MGRSTIRGATFLLFLVLAVCAGHAESDILKNVDNSQKTRDDIVPNDRRFIDREDDIILDDLDDFKFLENETELFPDLKRASLSSLQYSVECGIQNSPSPFTKVLPDDDDSGRIVGGADARPGEFPWQISLQRKTGYSGRHMCGGSILSENIVVTAAHCTQGYYPYQLQILAGADTLTYQSRYWQARNVKRILGLGYDEKTISRDIALLVLDKPLQFDRKHVAPVCLPSSNYIYNGKRGIISGWGTLSEGGRLASTLQVVSVPLIPVDECRTAYGPDKDGVMVTQCNICTGSKTGGLDSCQGDSGGPMTCVEEDGHHYLCGIVSWGTGCGDPDHPGVYTFTPCYANWIAQKVVQYRQH